MVAASSSPSGDTQDRRSPPSRGSPAALMLGSTFAGDASAWHGGTHAKLYAYPGGEMRDITLNR